MALVTVSGVNKQFGGQIVLEEVSLHIQPGETAGLIGLNGAGKTTLFRLIAREIPPDTGTITYARGIQVAYFRQEQPLTHERTVYDEAAEAFSNLHALERRMHDLAERIAAASVRSGHAERSEASPGLAGPEELEILRCAQNDTANCAQNDAENTSEVGRHGTKPPPKAVEKSGVTPPADPSPDREATRREAELGSLLAAYERTDGEFLAAGGHSYRAKLGEVLGGLGFSPADYERPLASLSGGERCRAALARLLLEDKPVLLLDEPTNHLDIDAVRWLEKFLAAYRGGVLLVSHDRYLLDRVCTRIVELSDRRVTNYSGNYSTYAETKATRELTIERQYRQDQEFIAKERAYIAKHLAGQRSRQAKGRRTRLERRLDAGELVTQTASTKAAAKIAFSESESRDQVVLRCEDLTAGIGDRPLVKGLTLQVYGGERIGITGPNGTGKTTLLRTILGELKPMAGAIQLSPRMTVGYYSQSGATLDPAKTILDEIRTARRDMSELQARSYMARFLFRGDDVFKPIGVLSGGEQSRVRLATLILSQPDILVLDEPTNHLDIPSREALEEALLDFNGAVLAVSHDRYFLDQLSQRLLVIRTEGHCIITGNYSDYVAHLESESARRAAEAEKPGGAPVSKKQKKAAKPTGKEQPAKTGPDTSAYNHLSIEQLEEMVMAREVRLGELHQRYGDPELYKDPDARAELEDEITLLSDELALIDAAWHERAGEG